MAQITDAERRARIDKAISEVKELRENPHTPRQAYWLSFVDPARPEGDRFIGACIIPDCVNMADAIGQAHAMKCNPGGEVAGYVLPERAFEEDQTLRDAPKWKLMKKDELLKLGITRDENSDR